MTVHPSIASWIESLKGEGARASDTRIRAMFDNPAQVPLESIEVLSAAPPPMPRTGAAIRAAVSDTFTFLDIRSPDSEADERAILANADTVMIAGKRRLRLTKEARAALINAVSGTELYQNILRIQEGIDGANFDAISDDEIRRNSAWMRCFLSGHFARLDRPPVTELRSALCAREQLAGVKLADTVPSISEVQRLLGLAELLEPLRILIGSEGGWDGVRPLEDRFVGREAELAQLRAFVDELASKGAIESVARGGAWLGERLGRVVTGRVVGPRVIVARGGLGKSSLVAKFMLDHALGAHKRFPFAYLDFDRAALQPREPRQLLLEIMRQVALQFPEMAEITESLSLSVRNELLSQSRSFSVPEGADAVDAFTEFRQFLQHRVTRGSHAFLLVLDTMEVVQSDPRALEGVVTFVNRLCGPQFPEARIVITGRADVPELRRSSNLRAEGRLQKLGALSVAEAREMATHLGRRLLGPGWLSKWSSRIAGVSSQPDSRREPLTVRVAVDLVRSAEAVERDALTKQIEKMGEDASENFVGMLYQRRVLDHVRDPEVKKLAWPGLVLRRVTLEIVNEVLAEPCQLKRELIPQTFQALGRETWIVDRDGDALRHQADLRASTLPLMRRKDSAKFDDVNGRAITYFEKRQASDLRCRAEWIYHRLMAGHSTEEIESDWSSELAPYLTGADADFPRDSQAASFLFAHTATRLDTGGKTEHLDVDLALEHIANTAPYLAGFDEEKLSKVICDLDIDDASPHDLTEPARMAYTSLAVKTGRWRLVRMGDAEELNHPMWRRPSEFARAYLATRTLFTAFPRFEEGNFGALAQRIAYKAIREDPSVVADEETLLNAFESSAWRVGPSDQSTLRTVMLFSPRLASHAADAWYRLMPRSNQGFKRVFSAAEIRALALGGNFRSVIRRIDKSIWQLVFEDPSPRRFLVTDPKIGTEAQGHLQSAMSAAKEVSTEVMKLQQFAAARDEDWIAPMAYAAYRATSGEIPVTCVNRAQSYTASTSGLLGSLGVKSNAGEVPSDILQLLTLADRAGDLAAMATLFADAYPGSSRARDLNRLLKAHSEWRHAVAQYLRRIEKGFASR